MSKLQTYYGTKQRVGALVLTAFMAANVGPALADTATANAALDSEGLIYSAEDSTATNLVVNSKDVLKEMAVNGQLPIEYRTLVVTPELTLTAENNMRGVILNRNFEKLFADPENFQYMSMGSLYMDNAEEKEFFDNLAIMITDVSLNPTIDGIQNILDLIRKFTPVLSVGGKQAVATDLFYLQALATVFDLKIDTEINVEYTQLDEMAKSFGENGDIIAYINAIRGQANCR